MTEQDNEVTKVVEDLVIAMLSVDSWTLEKSFALRDALQREEIFDLDTLADRAPTDVFERLERAGYARGDFMTDVMAKGGVDREQSRQPPLRDLDQRPQKIVVLTRVGPIEEREDHQELFFVYVQRIENGGRGLGDLEKRP